MDFLDLPKDIYFEIRTCLDPISLHALRTTCWNLLREKFLFPLTKPLQSEAFIKDIYYTRDYYDWIHTVVNFSGLVGLPIIRYLGWKKAFPILNDVDAFRRTPESILLNSYNVTDSLRYWSTYTQYMTKQGIKQYFEKVLIYYTFVHEIEQLWYAKHEMIMDLENFGGNKGTPLSNRNNFIRGTLGKYMKSDGNAPSFYRDIYKLYFYRPRQHRKNKK